MRHAPPVGALPAVSLSEGQTPNPWREGTRPTPAGPARAERLPAPHERCADVQRAEDDDGAQNCDGGNERRPKRHAIEG